MPRPVLRAFPVCCLLAVAAQAPAQGPGGAPAAPAAPAAPTAPAAPAAARPAQPASILLKGRLVTWQGQPIADAGLKVAPEPTDTAVVLQAPDVRSDADGRFELRVPPPDRSAPARRWLHIAAKGHASARRPLLWKAANDSQVAEPDDSESPGDAPLPTLAPVTDLEEIVLADGCRLVGRVRDPDGKPLAGVRVTLSDFAEEVRFRIDSGVDACCTASTGSDGQFLLPCALPVGAGLEFAAPGFYRQHLAPVSNATALDVTLERSGFVSGRVLDKHGKSVAGARVVLAYETRGEDDHGTSGADGSFRVSLAHPTRWRLQATTAREHRIDRGLLPVGFGPRENLELVLGEGEAGHAAERATVRAVAKQDGKPIAAFVVAAVWQEYANQNPNYFEYRIRSELQSGATGKDGIAEIPGPGEHDSGVGGLRVVAKGFAAATLKGLEWKDPEPGHTREPFLCELVPESTIAGRVVDERTGAAIAEARVWARAQQDPNQGTYEDGSEMPADAVKTGADGSFVLSGLGEGEWLVRVAHKQRPRTPPKSVTLKAEEHATALSLSIPAGAEVAGRITGLALGPGYKVFLHHFGTPQFGEQYNGVENGMTWSGGSTESVPNTIRPLGADGSFRFEGVRLDHHLLVVALPSPPRLGGGVFLPVEAFTVRSSGVRRDFDVGENRPGTLQGRITFPGVDVPFDRLVLVAMPVSEDFDGPPPPFVYSYSGPRSFVDAGGKWQVKVGTGRYHLMLLDLATGVRLAATEKPLAVGPEAAVVHDLAPMLARVEILLEKEEAATEMALADRIEIRCLPKAQQQQNMPGDESWDSGVCLDLRPGQTHAVLVLPPGEATFLVRNSAYRLLAGEAQFNAMPLGRADFEVAIGGNARTACTIKVGAPPEIPEPKKDEKGGDKAEPGDPSGPGKQP